LPLKTTFILSVIILNLYFDCFAQLGSGASENTLLMMSTESHNLNHSPSFLGNQALAAKMEKPIYGVFSEQKYIFDGINNVILFGGLPVFRNYVTAGLNFSGSELCNQTSISLGISKKLGVKMDVGLRFNYFIEHFSGYESNNFISADAGFVFHLSSTVHLGLQIDNACTAFLSKSGNPEVKIPYRCKWGLGYDVSDQFFIGFDFVKEENLKINMVTLLKYQLKKKISIKYTVSAIQMSNAIGIEWLQKKIHFQFVCAHHPQLGISAGVIICSNQIL